MRKSQYFPFCGVPIQSLVWRGPWLEIEPGTSCTRCQHSTTRHINTCSHSILYVNRVCLSIYSFLLSVNRFINIRLSELFFTNFEINQLTEVFIKVQIHIWCGWFKFSKQNKPPLILFFGRARRLSYIPDCTTQLWRDGPLQPPQLPPLVCLNHRAA